MGMRLDLRDLSLRGGDRRETNYRVDLAPLIIGGAEYQVLLQNGVDFAVDRAAGGYLVNVSAKAKVYGPCARCLREAALELTAKEQEFAPADGGSWDEADLSPFIDDLVVDVEALAREAVILSLPAQLLCAPTCKGLCGQCGRDLNVGDCGCSGLEISQEMG
jgi:uncharacterized protein